MRTRERLSIASLAAIACAGVFAWSRPARADDGEVRLLRYYDGERTSAYLVGGMGLAAAGGGAWLVTRPDDFDRALGWTWIGMGGVEVAGAVVYALQVDAEIDRYRSLLARDPAGYRAAETAHMRGTSSRFVYYRVVEVSLTLAGGAMAAYGFAADRDTWKGMGLGVGSLALPIAVIDTVNNARASSYLRSLEDGPTLGFFPTDRGGVVALQGRF